MNVLFSQKLYVLFFNYWYFFWNADCVCFGISATMLSHFPHFSAHPRRLCKNPYQLYTLWSKWKSNLVYFFFDMTGLSLFLILQRSAMTTREEFVTFLISSLAPKPKKRRWPWESVAAKLCPSGVNLQSYTAPWPWPWIWREKKKTWRKHTAVLFPDSEIRPVGPGLKLCYKNIGLSELLDGRPARGTPMHQIWSKKVCVNYRKTRTTGRKNEVQR